jgi:expansin (peptidoglycan-binding protein)
MSAVPPAAAPASAEVQPGTGTATHYDSTDGGNCSLPGPPADHLDVALSHVEYGTADSCGGYIDVTGPNGTVRVEITNQCPECDVHELDLSQTAFSRIGRLEDGVVPVSYELVRNPPLAQAIALRVKSGSSKWWLQIQPLDHGNPIARFELQTGSGWRSLVHTGDNFWMAENPGPGDGPFTVRITDIYGQSVTIDDVALAPDQVQRTTSRLYGSGAAPPAPPPTTAAPTTAPTTAPPTTAPPSTTTTLASTTTSTADDDTRQLAAVTKPDDSDGPATATSLALAAITFALTAGCWLGFRRSSGVR